MFLKSTVSVLLGLCSLSAFADGNRSITIRNEAGDRLEVFVNRNEPAVRCLCDRFSVMVKKANAGAVGSPAISQVVVQEFVRGPADGMVPMGEPQVLDRLTSVYRCLGSPTYTGQALFMRGVNRGGYYRIVAKARRCMNPTVAACRQLVPVIRGSFTSEQLSQLASVTPEELARPAGGCSR